MNSYSKSSTDEMALASATGISGGAANTIPSIFFSFSTSKGFLAQLTDLKFQQMETLEGEECYVIAGKSVVSAKDTLWISKARSLILKHEYSLERPAGSDPFHKISDKDLEEAIKAMGEKVTEETKNSMRKMMEQASKGAYQIFEDTRGRPVRVEA